MKKILLSVATSLSAVVFVNAQNLSPYWSLAGNSNATSSSKLGTTNAINLRLYTNNLERARITTSGLFGIGTTSPTDKLHVNSPSGINAFRAQVNGSTKLLVHNVGGVSIGSGSTPPSNGLYVSGSVRIGTTTSSSFKLDVRGSSTSGGAISAVGYAYGLSAYALDANGTGVYGSSRSIGVKGEASNYGTYGAAIGTGAYGYGDSYGTYGSSLDIGAYGSGENYGTYGYSYSGNAAYGISYDGTGVGGSSTNGNGGNFYSANGYGMRAGTGNSEGNWAGVFDGNVYSFGAFQTSDKNLKKNIKEFADAMSIINRLKPKNYEFRKDEKYASFNLPKGTHYGLIAQELQEVLPNLVSEVSEPIKTKPATAIKPDADGKPLPLVKQQKETQESINIKTVNYTELIPIVIKGLQELNETKDKQINDLQKQIDELKALVQTITEQGPGIISHSHALLKQNTPNPANNSTVIRYNTPEDARNAQILISDMKGRVLKAFTLSKGEGQISIRSGELPKGTYNYTLYVNSGKIDTKQMIIMK